MSMLPVTLADVHVGVALKWPIFDNQKRLLFRKGAVIRSEKQLEMLLKFGLQRNEQEDENAVNARESSVANPFDRINEAIARLPRIARPLFATDPDANTAEDIAQFTTRINGLCDELIDICQHDADAAIGDAHLNHSAPFSQSHPIHTALLSLLIAIHMDIPLERVRSLVCAALTANITITPLMETMHKQQGGLSEGQQTSLMQHPKGARDLLEKSGVKDPLWLDIVYQHHECLDGQGYPRKLKDADVLREAQILSLADDYYNLVFERSECVAPSPHEVIKALFVKCKDTPVAAYVHAMIKEFGIYPPGTVVALANNEVAIVVWRSADNTKPIVKAIISDQGAPFMKPRERDTHSTANAIREIYHARTQFHLNMLGLWGYER
ncbi:MAG: HD domain-containing phosphohydrolase [Pseudomonadota bacterium]